MTLTNNHCIVSYCRPDAHEGDEAQALQNMLHALKLWGSAYKPVYSEDELKKTLGEAQTEPNILVMDNHSTSTLDALNDLGNTEFICALGKFSEEYDSLQRHFPDINHFLNLAQGHLAITTLIAAVYKIVTKNIHGVDKYLTKGTPVHNFTLQHSDERHRHIQEVQDYILGLSSLIKSGSTEFARIASEVLDEFLMNAIWDASPKRKDDERRTPVELRPDEAIHIQWGLDGSVFALGVRDSYGTLSRDTLYNYSDIVLGTNSRSKVSVNNQKGGAGIGLHMILRRVSGLIVNDTPDRATEFIALFDITKSPRHISKGSKTFNYFTV